MLLKHCRHGKPHCCYVQLSDEETELSWVSASGKPRALSLSAVSRVVEGQTTPVFRHAQHGAFHHCLTYCRRNPDPRSKSTSFSLLYREDTSERTLDLVCKARI